MKQKTHRLLSITLGLAGALAVSLARADTNTLAFTFEPFDLPGASETLLSDIRNDGTLVGRFKDGGGISQGFVQSGTNLTTFNVTGTTATFAGGIDSFGRIAGFYRDAVDPDVQHGFIRETNGTFTTLDGPGQNYTYAWRINDAGQVNGYWFEDPFFITSFRRATNGVLTTNVFAGSPVGTVTRGMNEAGDTAGWKWDENYVLQGVVFAGGATNVFTVAGWENTLPGDINNLGDIAGTVNNGFTNTAGFFRRANGDTVTFNPPGAVEVEVFGMNDLGQVVGEYADAGGARHGFIACPAVALERGHTDVGVAYEDGEFNLHIHDEETDTEYTPKDAALIIGGAAEQPIPDTAALSFLGRPGYSTWILPAVQNTNLLFLGFGAEEIESGVFVGDALRMELVSVVGAGDFAVFAFDGFGNPIVHMNSADGISAADFFPLVAGGHTDLNWAFNAPGTYRIGFRVRGTLVAGNQEVVSDIAYYTFTVPEALLPQPPEQDDSFVYNVVDIGTFGGTEFNTAIDVNNAGVVVGGSSLSNNVDHPIFRWQDGVLENLGLLGGRTAGAEAISETGWIAGTTTTPAGDFEPYVPYRFGPNGFEAIPLILGAQNGEAHDVNDFGTTVGTLDLPDFSSRAFLSFTNAPTIDLGTFGGESSGVEGINNSGVLVGWAQLSNGQTRAFRHVGTGPLNAATDDLGTLGGNSSRAFAVSESGKVVGRSRTTNGVQHAFLWEQSAGMTDLGSLGGDNTYAFGINTNDVVTGWGNLVPGGDPNHGWVWTRDTGMRDLNTLIPFGTGLEITLAYGVNESGWIAGGADRLSDGATRPVLFKPATRLSRGHTDIGMAFEDGAWDLHVHAEDIDTEFTPGAALLTLPPLTQTIVPTNASYAFLGAAGSPAWVLPPVQNPKLLFLGFGAEEIESGVFVSNIVTMKLKSVDGPGAFSVFSIDGFGVPQVHMNSGDGIDGTNDVKSIVTGSHEDFAWAFSAPGYYRVTFEACGTLVAGNEFTTSGDVTYFFEVIGIETQLAITRSGGSATISFVTQDGLTYQLEAASTITGPWTDEGAAFLGTGRAKQITVPLSPGAVFFRMKASAGN